MDNQDDNTFIADGVVQAATNLLFDDFGIPYPRPGITKLYHGDSVYGAGSPVFYILGTYRNASAQGKVFVAIQVINSVGNQIFYVGLDSTLVKLASTPQAKTTFANTYQYTKILEYNSKLYLVPVDDGASVGQSANIGPPIGAYTAVPAMPRGHQAFILRDRMFIINKTTSRVYFSKATDPTVWAAPDGGFFDVNPSDGESIRSVVVNNDIMYIFKLTRTWVFAFAADPGLDGTLRLINQDEGAIDSVEYNGSIYVLTRNGIAQFINGQYVDIGRAFIKRLDINLGYTGTGIFVVGKFLYVYLGNSLTTIYAMNLLTRAWSKLSFDSAPAGNPFTSVYGRPENLEGTPFVIGSSGAVLWLSTLDGTATYDTDTSNAVTCPHWYLLSKRYVINTYLLFKQLRYFMLYSNINLDPDDASPAVSMILESNNVLNTEINPLADSPPEYERIAASGRFNAFSISVDKPLSGTVGVTIDLAGRPVGAVQPDFQIKQFTVIYTETAGHLAGAS